MYPAACINNTIVLALLRPMTLSSLPSMPIMYGCRIGSSILKPPAQSLQSPASMSLSMMASGIGLNRMWVISRSWKWSVRTVAKRHVRHATQFLTCRATSTFPAFRYQSIKLQGKSTGGSWNLSVQQLVAWSSPPVLKSNTDYTLVINLYTKHETLQLGVKDPVLLSLSFDN